MSGETYTYTGVWVNWSHGLIHGTTLTLSQQHGGLLAAFLALYVSFAGGMFWRMLSFVLHQTNATSPSKTRDWIHHQRQVILRNSGTGSGGATLSLFKLSFALRGRARLRCFLFALVALLTVALFSVAGIFTSTITKVPGNSTLVLGASCGGFKLNYATAGKDPNWLSKNLGDTVQAATYVRQCYQNSTSSLGCGTFVRPSIPFSIHKNAPCPFESSLCIIGDTAAFSMDTGRLDSHVYFGINAAPKNRILFRRKATCAPIHGKPFGVAQNGSLGEVLYIDAGPSVVGLNYTFQYFAHDIDDGFGYQLSAVNSMAVKAGASVPYQWSPVPPLQRSDADVTLMMLTQNDVTYLAPSDDPWMSAHITGEGDGQRVWVGDHDVNLLGCIDQYQICNPNIPGDAGCTALSGAFKVSDSLSQPSGLLGMNAEQRLTIQRFLLTSFFRSMYYAVKGRGASALNAQEHTFEDVQIYLPPTQWQTEVSLWFSNCLAKEQQWAVEWATAPSNIDFSLGNNVSTSLLPNPPSDAVGKSACRQQMIRNTGAYMSFSVLGMALIFALGGLIILIGFTVDLVTTKYGRPQSKYKREEWEAEEMLALHKTAYVAGGYWEDDSNEELPPIIVFANPDTAQVKHEQVVVVGKDDQSDSLEIVT